MDIAGHELATQANPFVIAEISANHHQDLAEALSLIEAAASSGANAVKFQTYRADTMTLDLKTGDFIIREGPWKGSSLFDLYKNAQMDWSWHRELYDKAKSLGLAFLSSAFDYSAVDELVNLGADAIKIASFELSDGPLIRYAAETGLPLILSTGAARLDEIEEAVDWASHGTSDLVVMHCVSAYPAKSSDYRIGNIPFLAKHFGTPTGLSDHTQGNGVAAASVALGASVFEKHFTIDSSADGADDFFSATPDSFRMYVETIRDAAASLNGPDFSLTESETPYRQFKRSLYFVESLQKGTTVQDSHVRSIRPGLGLSPNRVGEVLGRRLISDVSAGQRVQLELLES